MGWHTPEPDWTDASGEPGDIVTDQFDPQLDADLGKPRYRSRPLVLPNDDPWPSAQPAPRSAVEQ